MSNKQIWRNMAQWLKGGGKKRKRIEKRVNSQEEPRRDNTEQWWRQVPWLTGTQMREYIEEQISTQITVPILGIVEGVDPMAMVEALQELKGIKEEGRRNQKVSRRDGASCVQAHTGH